MKVLDLQIERNAQLIKPSGAPQRVKTNKEVQSGKVKKPDTTFAKVYEQKVADNVGLRFSAHALRRLDERQINLSSADLNRLQDGVKLAEEKGARSSLILMNNQAYIVSVRNRTVVTALTGEAMLGNVFTNIDSVAVM